MARIESLLPRSVADVSYGDVLRTWRSSLKKELGKEKFRKTIRRLSMKGVSLQVEDGRVVNYFSLDQLDDDVLLGMRGSGWLVFEGVENRPGQPLNEIWETEASCAEEVDWQEKGGYKKKYRHANHRQEIKSTWKKIVYDINGK